MIIARRGRHSLIPMQGFSHFSAKNLAFFISFYDAAIKINILKTPGIEWDTTL